MTILACYSHQDQLSLAIPSWLHTCNKYKNKPSVTASGISTYRLNGLYSFGGMARWHALLSLSLPPSLSLSLPHFNGHFARWISVSQYQNVCILDFIGAKDDVGVVTTGAKKKCKASVKSSPSTNRHPAFYRPDARHVAQPTVSEHWR